MLFVTSEPEMLISAAGNLRSIGGATNASNASLGSGAPGLLGGMPLSGAAGRANAAQDGIAPLRVPPQLIG